MIVDSTFNIAYDISPVDSLLCFATLGPAGLFRTTDGGRSWTKLVNYSGPAYYVHFFDENIGWAFSGPFSRYELRRGIKMIHSVTTDGGESWTRFGGKEWDAPSGSSLPEFDSSEYILTVTLSEAYDVYGETIAIGMSNGSVWISDDRGYHWKRISTPLSTESGSVVTLSLASESSMLVAGCFIDKWQDTLIVAGGSGQMGRKAKAFTTSDQGDSWVESSPPVNPVASSELPGKEGAYVLGGYINMWNSSSGICMTRNDGRTWTMQDPNRVWAMDFLDSGTGYAATMNAPYWRDTHGYVLRWYPTVSPETGSNRLIWFALPFGIVFLAGVGWKTYSSRERATARSTRRVRSLEQQALRAKLEPEFIFLHLKAIRLLINLDERAKANDYIAKFARFARRMLDHSSQDTVSLEDHIEITTLYLELLKLSSMDKFEFEISVDQDLDLFDWGVPPLIIKSVLHESVGDDLHNWEVNSQPIRVVYLSDSEGLLIRLESEQVSWTGGSLESHPGILVTKQESAIALKLDQNFYSNS